MKPQHFALDFLLLVLGSYFSGLFFNIFKTQTETNNKFICTYPSGWSARCVDIQSSELCKLINEEGCPSFSSNPKIEEEINKMQSSYYRTYRFETRKTSEQETCRWNYITNKHLYEMINQDPRIGLNGMWRLEMEQLNKYALQVLSKETGRSNYVMEDILRHHDPYEGVRYLLNYHQQDDTSNLVTVELTRKYSGGKPNLKSVTSQDDVIKPINIVMSLSKVSSRFTNFLARYERTILARMTSHHQSVRMTIVVASVVGADTSDATDTMQTIDNFKSRNQHCDVTNYITTRDFYNKGADLHDAISKSTDDEIALVIDVDMHITWEFLDRVRRNTVKNERVFFPVSFSQYDPDIMEGAAKLDNSLAPLVTSEKEIVVNEERGFWMHYAYGIVGMYKDDYFKVGGFKLDIKGWGVEDVDLYKRFVSHPQLQVMSAIDRDLVHVYHKRNCDVTLELIQYQRCIGAWAEMLASHRQAGLLYDDLSSKSSSSKFEPLLSS